MSDSTNEGVLQVVRDAFERANISLNNSTVRRFPGETIVLVEVDENDFSEAVSVANELDSQLENGFVTVKKSRREQAKAPRVRATSLIDPRINDLIELLNARSRTSEQQPSLHYVLDAEENLNVAASRRHHLIFGRRGVGKTALMLEAKKLVESRGASTFWLNVQTMRSLSAYEAFLTTASRLCDLPSVVHAGRPKVPLSVLRSTILGEKIRQQLSLRTIREEEVNRLVPQIQEVFHAFGQETQEDLYVFLDDIHYLSTREQPKFLDMIHSLTRDNAIWIKASGIKHQSRWFTDNPPTGLQTSHDAAIINLDVTLEQPAKAKAFLTNILRTYIDEVKLLSLSDVISREALDRLVLASGGVPRDCLILSATAIQVARQRPNARATGVQDVNQAAGNISKIKIQELEDDAASSIGMSSPRTESLLSISEFLLNQKQVTYFRIDFQDKETHSTEYDLLQSLMDLRLIHLINGSLSDEREAGRRSEVYMLDLSQFSGMRFKRNLLVLDFTKDYLVLKRTGGTTPSRPGDTADKLKNILRRGPLFPLSDLSAFVNAANP